MDGAAEWLALIGAVGVALGVITKWVIRPLMRFHAGMARFLEDWNGRPDRPGFQGHPGAMARLGVRPPGERTVRDLHQGDFDVDEHAITVGVELFTAAALLDAHR